MSIAEKLSPYENYLQTVKEATITMWLNYYSKEFLLEHLGEARIYENSLPKPHENRTLFLTNWFIRARREEKAASGSYLLANEYRLKREREERIEENSSYD